MEYELLTAREIELIARSHGMTIVELCKQAGIAETTFFDWKSGRCEPTLKVYRRLLDVVMPVKGEAT